MSWFLPPTDFSAPSTALIPCDLPDSPLCPAPCTSPPSRALPGTFAPWPGLIHLATPLRPGELKALFVCTPWEILTPRLHAPTKQRKHLLTAKALTNSVFQMNPAPCGAEGGACPGQKSPKRLLVFADYRKPGGAVLRSCRVDSLQLRFLLRHVMASTTGKKEKSISTNPHTHTSQVCEETPH